MRCYPVIPYMFFCVVYSLKVSALPIGFGINKDKLEYRELKDKDFLIYHDKRTPNEAKLALESLSKAKHHLQRWFKIPSTDRLSVITSAASSNASFANIITNNLEVQTLGQGNRDLFWHEYVHNMMYQHFFNILGPAGAVLHLPWMSNWWIEGLAEAISQSEGSDIQATSERLAALTDRWPSFDSLHSLYRSEANQQIGYTISGSFVSYILRNSNPNKLGKFHKDFYNYTMPWYMLWSALPFNGFMPMDKSLENFTNKKANILFRHFKKDSKKHWQKNAPAALLMHKKFYSERPSIFGSGSRFDVRDEKLRYYTFEDSKIKTSEIEFNERHWGVVSQYIVGTKLPQNTLSKPIIIRKKYAPVVVRYKSRFRQEAAYEIWVKSKSTLPYQKALTRDARIKEFVEGPKHLVWIEQDTETTRVCRITKKDLFSHNHSATKCDLNYKIPKSISYLGSSNPSNRAKNNLAWFSIRTQTATGDQFEILKLDLRNFSSSAVKLDIPAKPIRLAAQKDHLWVITAHKTHRRLSVFDGTGACLGQIPFSELLKDVYLLRDQTLAVRLSNMHEDAIYSIADVQKAMSPCRDSSAHISPLLVATRANKPIAFKAAFQKADLWSKSSLRKRTAQNTAPPLGNNVKATSTKAQYRLKHVVTSPWLSADPYGTTVGVLSLPIMEISQNEEARLGLFYGLASKYPDVNLTLTSTRFWPTIELNAYKSIRFNGQFAVTDTATDERRIVSSFFDELGVGLNSTFVFNPHPFSLKLGYLFKNQKVHDGPRQIRTGNTHELSISITNRFSLGNFVFSTQLAAASAPEQANKDFVYNRFSANHTISTPFILSSHLSLGLEHQRTRGSKQPNLRELYRPLKTFVPGEGGGSNFFHFEASDLFGIDSGRIFSALYGSNQTRAKINWTIPIVQKFDKLLWIFYLNRLDLSSFYNVGSAWNRKFPRFKDLQQAHGHSLDFQFEIKGINFSLGLGTGHVFGANYDYFLTFSFDDIFQL